jgi:hypothetical protein
MDAAWRLTTRKARARPKRSVLFAGDGIFHILIPSSNVSVEQRRREVGWRDI